MEGAVAAFEDISELNGNLLDSSANQAKSTQYLADIFASFRKTASTADSTIEVACLIKTRKTKRTASQYC